MRTIVLVDGQNLYHGAKDAWSGGVQRGLNPYTWPSYDVEKLAQCLVDLKPGRKLVQARFYTGVPDLRPRDRKSRLWHGFWTNKLRALKSRGVYVYKGRVNPGGQEKGVDVSLAIDLIRLTYEDAYDLGIIVSQDWDFGPAVWLAKRIADDEGRTVTFESAFAYGPGSKNDRGIPGTVWVKIDQKTYDGCFDPTDYRPREFR